MKQSDLYKIEDEIKGFVYKELVNKANMWFLIYLVLAGFSLFFKSWARYILFLITAFLLSVITKSFDKNAIKILFKEDTIHYDNEIIELKGIKEFTIGKSLQKYFLMRITMKDNRVHLIFGRMEYMEIVRKYFIENNLVEKVKLGDHLKRVFTGGYLFLFVIFIVLFGNLIGIL